MVAAVPVREYRCFVRARGTIATFGDITALPVLLYLPNEVFAFLLVIQADPTIRLQFSAGAVQGIAKAIIFTGLERFVAVRIFG